MSWARRHWLASKLASSRNARDPRAALASVIGELFADDASIWIRRNLTVDELVDRLAAGGSPSGRYSHVCSSCSPFGATVKATLPGIAAVDSCISPSALPKRRSTTLKLAGAGDILLYQPKHPKTHSLSEAATMSARRRLAALPVGCDRRGLEGSEHPRIDLELGAVQVRVGGGSGAAEAARRPGLLKL